MHIMQTGKEDSFQSVDNFEVKINLLWFQVHSHVTCAFAFFFHLCCYFYRPQTKFAKVMFLQVSVCPRGGCVAGGWGACMEGGMHGWGVCTWWGRGMRGGGHVWQGVCMAGDMHGRGASYWNAFLSWKCKHKVSTQLLVSIELIVENVTCEQGFTESRRELHYLHDFASEIGSKCTYYCPQTKFGAR